MPSRTILVVEDDAAIRRGIVDALSYEGYDTLEAGDGRQGLTSALRATYDLLLLDLVLPYHDGFQILREVRVARPTLPVILLTARGEEQDRVRGLRMGADDYVVKPFSVRELLARVGAVLRRSPERPSDRREIPVPGGLVDLDRSAIRFDDGAELLLTARECELLRYLASNAGRPVSREELLARVWRVDPLRALDSRTVDVHVGRLRAKLRDDKDSPRLLVTIRGKGYLFTATAERDGDGDSPEAGG